MKKFLIIVMALFIAVNSFGDWIYKRNFNPMTGKIQYYFICNDIVGVEGYFETKPIIVLRLTKKTASIKSFIETYVVWGGNIIGLPYNGVDVAVKFDSEKSILLQNSKLSDNGMATFFFGDESIYMFTFCLYHSYLTVRTWDTNERPFTVTFNIKNLTEVVEYSEAKSTVEYILDKIAEYMKSKKR